MDSVNNRTAGVYLTPLPQLPADTLPSPSSAVPRPAEEPASEKLPPKSSTLDKFLKKAKSIPNFGQKDSTLLLATPAVPSSSESPADTSTKRAATFPRLKKALSASNLNWSGMSEKEANKFLEKVRAAPVTQLKQTTVEYNEEDAKKERTEAEILADVKQNFKKLYQPVERLASARAEAIQEVMQTKGLDGEQAAIHVDDIFRKKLMQLGAKKFVATLNAPDPTDYKQSPEEIAANLANSKAAFQANLLERKKLLEQTRKKNDPLRDSISSMSSVRPGEPAASKGVGGGEASLSMPPIPPIPNSASTKIKRTHLGHAAKDSISVAKSRIKDNP